jgi:hypothetical protein
MIETKQITKAMPVDAGQKQQLVGLAERLDPNQFAAALRFIRSLLVDPVWLSLMAAPEDDEPGTPEDETALAEARESFARGEGIPHEEILREFER